MTHNLQFFIQGAWVNPATPKPYDVINPATEEVAGTISLGSAADVDRAVAAAKAAFETFSQTSRDERIGLLNRIVEAYKARYDEIAATITAEMGAPSWFARDVQTETALAHFREAIKVLRDFHFEYPMGGTLIRREPFGVCGLITPWNWPLNQVVAKLAPAIAAGCTVVLKPSELAPLSAIILAEVMEAAATPPGVFNLVNGDGPTVGHAISSHPDIDLVSFTGSTRAGILVAKAAADSVKKVHQELGGKSANIILPDVNLPEAVSHGILRSFTNCGQSCQAPTRMLVQRDQMDEAMAIARTTVDAIVVGDPLSPKTRLGPLANAAQYTKVQALIASGIDEGATLVCGGLGHPAGVNRGYFVRPTVFAHVRPDMRIAREEIFGPVLSMLPYEDEEDAIAIANGTVYGLAGYVHSGDLGNARRVASRLRAGRVYINGAISDVIAPFGGYKQSGNGREQGIFGLEEFLEIKAVLGYEQAV